MVLLCALIWVVLLVHLAGSWLRYLGYGRWVWGLR